MSEFVMLFLTTALVFVIQKFLQFTWDKLVPENKNKKRGSRYGKKKRYVIFKR